jgi:hypothetical protein
MTDIRSSGFGSKAELQQHLSDLDDDAVVADPAEVEENPDERDAAIREIGWLRKEVLDLRETLAMIHERDNVRSTANKTHTWLKIAAAVAATYLMGRVVQSL